MVCLDTPTSRATSSTARPASTCFKALIISASLCLPLDMVLPLSFDEIIFNFVRNQGSRSLRGLGANSIFGNAYFSKLSSEQTTVLQMMARNVGLFYLENRFARRKD